MYVSEVVDAIVHLLLQLVELHQRELFELLELELDLGLVLLLGVDSLAEVLNSVLTWLVLVPRYAPPGPSQL